MTSPVDLRERKFISQYSPDPLGLVVHKAGVPADVDGNLLTVSMRNEETTNVVFTREADHEATGVYQVTLSSVESSVPGPYEIIWTYELDAIAQEYHTFIEVGTAAPPYDELHPDMKDIVDKVWILFADLFDSPEGGPNLMTYYQAHWSRGRMAQLLPWALGRLNTMAQPHQSFTLDGTGGAQFPLDEYGSLLQTALYVECIKHLIRSYVEQPNFVGGSVTRLDRRDYMDRWQSVLAGEEAVLQSQRDVFKIRAMSLGRPKVLIAGGVFGRFAPTRIAGSVVARPRYWARFF